MGVAHTVGPRLIRKYTFRQRPSEEDNFSKNLHSVMFSKHDHPPNIVHKLIQIYLTASFPSKCSSRISKRSNSKDLVPKVQFVMPIQSLIHLAVFFAQTKYVLDHCENVYILHHM